MRKTEMSAGQRRLISRLCQIISGGDFVRGTLTERMLTCGKPNCRCSRGEKHRTLYLSVSITGRVQQIYIPRSWELRVKRMVGRHKKIRDILEKICEKELQRIKERKD